MLMPLIWGPHFENYCFTVILFASVHTSRKFLPKERKITYLVTEIGRRNWPFKALLCSHSCGSASLQTGNILVCSWPWSRLFASVRSGQWFPRTASDSVRKSANSERMMQKPIGTPHLHHILQSCFWVITLIFNLLLCLSQWVWASVSLYDIIFWPHEISTNYRIIGTHFSSLQLASVAKNYSFPSQKRENFSASSQFGRHTTLWGELSKAVDFINCY